MFERVLNGFWILLGAASAAYAWKLGLVGPSGPESGLFPLIAALIVMGTGVALMVTPSHRATAPEFPRDAALHRVLGVVAGLALMAVALPYLGFAVAGALTMLVLLRTVERVSWTGSVARALGSVVVVMWLFGNVLGMPLPRGPWGW
jgi:putative tricarboxylic transport membrane protein